MPAFYRFSWAGDWRAGWAQHWGRAQRETGEAGTGGTVSGMVSEGLCGCSSLGCRLKALQYVPTVVLNEMHRINDFSDSSLQPPTLELIVWFASCSGVQYHVSYL